MTKEKVLIKKEVARARAVREKVAPERVGADFELSRGPVLAALSYFDAQEYPLTLVELRKYLWFGPGGERAGAGGTTEVPGKLSGKDRRSRIGDYSLENIERAILEDEVLRERVSERRGFYFLAGREGLVERRIERYKKGIRLWRRAERAVRLFRFIPFVRMVGICNTLAIENADEDQGSDIDIFLIAARGRLWMTRVLCSFTAELLGLRQKVPKVAGRLCFSFSISEEALDLSAIAIRPYDIYLAYWVRQVYPLYDGGGVFQRFVQANGWVERWLPFGQAVRPASKRRVDDSRFSRAVKAGLEWVFLGWFGRVANWAAKRLQLATMKRHRHSKLGEDNTEVIVNDSMLKFHEVDTRVQVRREFEARLLGE